MPQPEGTPANLYPADYLHRVLSALRDNPRLRDLLGDDPLSKLSIRVLTDGLAVEPSDDSGMDRRGVRLVNDCVREALSGELGQGASPILAPRMSTSAGPGPHAIAARSHMQAGNPGRAVEILEAALARWPDSVELNTYHAVALGALGRDEQAVKAYEKVLVTDPESVFARAGLSRLLAKLGRWDEAHEQARQGLALRSTDPDLLHVFALACEKRGEFAEAERALRKALQAKPDLRGAQSDLRRIAMSRKLDEEISLLDDTPQEKPAEPMSVEFVAESPVEPEAPLAEPAPTPAPSPVEELIEDGRWAVATRSSPRPGEVTCAACKAPNPRGIGFCIKCGARMD